jgi:hypothetical protein
MFVPRALRLKGVHEAQRPQLSKPPSVHKYERSKDEALVDAMEGISTNSPVPQEEHIEPKAVARGPKFTVRPITPEYLAQLSAGVELIFTDYAHQEEERASWLQHRYRTVDGEEKCKCASLETQATQTDPNLDLHMTAILEHHNVSTLKPEATQVLLQQALREYPSNMLEVTSNGYHVRRIPSSYPPKFLPHNSFEQVDDDGLSFWDQRTIYVEPHLRSVCQTPAKLAYWLKEHGKLRSKWLPIQAVHTLYNSCAFVILSGSVMHESTWSKWRAAEKPENWKVMTKVEHTKRTTEYVALLESRKPRSMRKAKVEEIAKPAILIPKIAKPAALAMDVEIVPEYAAAPSRPKNKRKRNRRKGDKGDPQAEPFGTNNGNLAADAQSDEPASKRRG